MRSCRQNGRSLRAGYSLVEVTLALLVVAIGLTATFALFPEGLKASRTAVDDTEISLFAEYVFTTLDLTAGRFGDAWYKTPADIGNTDIFKSLLLARPSQYPDQAKFQLEVNQLAVFYWVPDYYGLSAANFAGTDFDAAYFQRFWTSAFTYELNIINGTWKNLGTPGVVKSAVLKVWPGEYDGSQPKGEPRIFYREILPFR